MMGPNVGGGGAGYCLAICWLEGFFRCSVLFFVALGFVGAFCLWSLVLVVVWLGRPLGAGVLFSTQGVVLAVS